MNRTRSSNCLGIEVFSWRKGSKEWEISWIRHGDLYQPSLEAATDGVDVTIFCPTQLLCYFDSRSGAERDTVVAQLCASCIEYLERSFEFLSFFWEPVYIDSNGYFGYQDDIEEDGNVVGLSTGARFLIQHFNDFRSIDEGINHKWRDIIVFTNWVKATKKTKILFLRTDTKALERIMAEILENLQRSPTSDPLWPYITIIDDYLNLQHKATYAIRDMTEAQEWRAEMPADSRQLEPKTDYTRLHEISRYALTVTEILKVNIKTLGDIVKYHGEFMEQERSNSSSGPDVTVRKTHQRFLLYAHMVHSICCRCSSYRDRMKNEIQLAFNVVSQDEAHTSVEIAKATKADSQAMKLTSLVALVFLPPTFLSAIFSTTFFEFGAEENSWGISKKFYLYWVLAIPITIASIFLWYLYIFNSVVVISTPKYLGKRISKARCVDVEN